MKVKTHAPTGLSLLEVFVVIATIVLLAIILPTLVSPGAHSKTRARRIQCVNNLKQIGLADLLYANDHEDKFPWMVSTNFNPTNTSGSREFTNSPQVFRHFQAISNELSVARILHCPSDDGREKAADFVNLSNSNLSYFLTFDASEATPQMILSGDRNITGGTLASPNLFWVPSGSLLSWTKSMHVSAGNIVLADGSVQQMTSSTLQKQLQLQPLPVVRLAIP